MDLARRRRQAAPGDGDAALVPDGSGAGTVLRAEVETTLDGTTVIALLPPKGKSASAQVETHRVLGTPADGPGRQRGAGLASPKRRRDDAYRRATATATVRRRPSEPATAAPSGGRPRPRGADRRTVRRGDGPGRRAPSGGVPHATGPARPGGRESGGRDAPPARRRPPPTATPPWPPSSPSSSPWPSSCSRGGIPAVRQAIEEQNARARAEGRPEVTPGPLLALAEQLLPVINLAIVEGPGLGGPRRGQGRPAPRAPLHRRLGLDGHPRRRGHRDGHRPPRPRSTSGSPPSGSAGWSGSPSPSTRAGSPTPSGPRSARPSRPPGSPPSWPSAWPRPPGRPWRPTTTARRLAGPARGGGRLPGPPDGQAGRASRPGPTRPLLAAARKASGYVPELARLMGIPIPPPPGSPPSGAGPHAAGPSVQPDHAGLRPGPAVVSPSWRCMVSIRALNPADSKKLLAARSPGRAAAVDPGAPLRLEPGQGRSSRRLAEPTPRAAGST